MRLMADQAHGAFCMSCGASAPADAAFCGQCGKPLAGGAPAARPAASRWYHNSLFVLFMLFCVLGPFGLPLVWKSPRFSRLVKFLLTLAMVAYTVLLVQMTIKLFQAAMDEANKFNSTLQF